MLNHDQRVQELELELMTRENNATELNVSVNFVGY